MSDLFKLVEICSPDFNLVLFLTPIALRMLPQRILARRLPQVAARHAIAPRATFSQVSALRATAEVEDPLQVRISKTCHITIPVVPALSYSRISPNDCL